VVIEASLVSARRAWRMSFSTGNGAGRGPYYKGAPTKLALAYRTSLVVEALRGRIAGSPTFVPCYRTCGSRAHSPATEVHERHSDLPRLPRLGEPRPRCVSSKQWLASARHSPNVLRSCYSLTISSVRRRLT